MLNTQNRTMKEKFLPLGLIGMSLKLLLGVIVLKTSWGPRCLSFQHEELLTHRLKHKTVEKNVFK